MHIVFQFDFVPFDKVSLFVGIHEQERVGVRIVMNSFLVFSKYKEPFGGSDFRQLVEDVVEVRLT